MAARPMKKPPAVEGWGLSSPTWTRTKNLSVNSRLLCQLSYRGRRNNFSTLPNLAASPNRRHSAWRALPHRSIRSRAGPALSKIQEIVSRENSGNRVASGGFLACRGRPCTDLLSFRKMPGRMARRNGPSPVGPGLHEVTLAWPLPPTTYGNSGDHPPTKSHCARTRPARDRSPEFSKHPSPEFSKRRGARRALWSRRRN